ncbi:ATP-dependent DNA helicase PIF1 [Gammaproteobacteria bacterium]
MAIIEINEQFRTAFKLIENSKRNLLILGKAGTGKSTFLHFCRDRTTKKMAVLAPTGVAAINIGGVTIHSFFGFPIDITLEKIKKLPKHDERHRLLGQLDTIVIDEISVVRADLLDCVAKFLTLNGPYPLEPFGGIQMIFIGDLYQIPPVVKSDVAAFFTTFYQSPYFFSSKSYITHASSFTLIEFEKIYRQTDISFINLLNAIRNNTVTNVHLMELNKRFQPGFKVKENEFWIYITDTNKAVKRINDVMLDRLKNRENVYQAKITGESKQESFPTDIELRLLNRMRFNNFYAAYKVMPNQSIIALNL